MEDQHQQAEAAIPSFSASIVPLQMLRVRGDGNAALPLNSFLGVYSWYRISSPQQNLFYDLSQRRQERFRTLLQPKFRLPEESESSICMQPRSIFLRKAGTHDDRDLRRCRI